MSNSKLLPFNIKLLVLKEADIKTIRPVKVQDIFDGFSRNFHQDGLMSTEIFGKVGEERRNRLFSYIDLKLEIFHPIVFKAICDLKAFYGEILAGREYAIFDKTINDFVKSTPIDGETGYSFFAKHFKNLKFEEKPSPKREFNIKMINKYRDDCLLDKLVVLPAGLRDYEIDENGKPSEDEINVMYRKVIGIANMATNVDMRINPEYFDNMRYNLQKNISEIYDYIKNMLEGKHGFILGKWTTRGVFNSTRNVITPFIPETTELNSPKAISTNQTVVGLYQYLRAILPLAVKHVRDTFLTDVFLGPNSPAMLVNRKTLKKEPVTIDPSIYDEWMTFEGLEKTMARFSEENIRHEYIEIEDHYLGLIYKGSDNTYKFVQDKNQLPSGRTADELFPITFTELLYLSVYKDSATIPAFVTRYPITGYGSIYPSYLYLKTTTKSEIRTELNDNWEPTESIANEFPIISAPFFNSMSPSHAHLPRLTADFDRRI